MAVSITGMSGGAVIHCVTLSGSSSGISGSGIGSIDRNDFDSFNGHSFDIVSVILRLGIIRAFFSGFIAARIMRTMPGAFLCTMAGGVVETKDANRSGLS
jgi:hypothetical protein